MGYSRKKKKQVGRGGVVSHLRIYFPEKEPGNLTFATLGSYLYEIKNSTKLCDNTLHCFLWKSQSQKPELIEIPHESFWNTPENSTSFIIDLWNLQYSYCVCRMCLKIRVRSSSNEWKSRWVNPSNFYKINLIQRFLWAISPNH